MTAVPVSKLLAWSAFEYPIWYQMKDPITFEEVTLAIEENRLEQESYSHEYDQGREDLDPDETRRVHVERVAYLVVNPTDDPICLNFGCYWAVRDGNHRLAAAIFRGDETINCSGDVLDII